MTTFTDIFCYAQINCEDNMLAILNSLYGLSYTDKYRCISKYYSNLGMNGGNGGNLNGGNGSTISSRIKLEIIKR